MFPAPVKHPKPPKWSDEQAVLDLITRWFGEHEYREAMEQAQLDDGPRRPSRRELVEMIRSGGEISPQNWAHIANMLERDGIEQSKQSEQPKRKRGRPPKPIEGRRSVSIMPEAEALCLSVIDFLRANYPKERAGIRDRAITWTAAKMGTYEVGGVDPLTEEKLRNYMARSKRARQKL
jgi:hypothetical protein